MFKKLISIAIITLMMFSLAACNQAALSGDNELAGYKASAMSELEAYTESKGQDEYSDADWERIMLLFSKAESAIGEAKNASEIESIVETIKKEIDNDIEDILIRHKIFLSQFDLTDPTIFWTRSIDDDFDDDRVVVVLKRTTTYPKLELRDFGLDNGERLEYIWFKPHKDPSPNFRQILVIYLKQHGKDKVVEAIKQLEKLSFIKAAEPNYIFGTQDN